MLQPHYYDKNWRWPSLACVRLSRTSPVRIAGILNDAHAPIFVEHDLLPLYLSSQ